MAYVFTVSGLNSYNEMRPESLTQLLVPHVFIMSGPNSYSEMCSDHLAHLQLNMFTSLC